MNYPIVTSYGRRQSTPMSLPQMKKNHADMAIWHFHIVLLVV